MTAVSSSTGTRSVWGEKITAATILIVDDDLLYLNMVEQVLDLAGIRADYAASGEEAVGRMRDSRYSVLVTDLNMPGMDGFELAMIAREVSPDIRITMVTGELFPDPDLVAMAGISEVLSRPCNIADLLRVVQSE